MSVYIKGMEMPRGCASCKISRRNGKKMICPFIWKCEWDIHDPMSAGHRLDGCPLVPVPPHGDLIDLDALSKSLDRLCDRVCQYSKAQRKAMCDACPLGDAFTVVEDDAPTIIPAEEGE